VTSTRRSQIIGIILVNVATLSWATNMTLARWLRADIGPITLAAARFAIAAVLFVLLLQRRPPAERRMGRDRWLLVGMAISGVVLFSPALYLGLRFTTAVSATLINSFGPLVTGLLAAVLIHEPMSRRQVSGALVGLLGVASLIAGSANASLQQSRINIGDLIVLGAVTLWALYSVLGRRVMRHRSALSTTAFSAFLGLPLLLLGAAWEIQTLPPRLGPQLVVAILYIGVAPTVIGFVAWNEGVRRLGSSGAMVFYNTLALYGALLGFLLLDESVGLAHLVGGALIIGGGLWAALGNLTQSRENGKVRIGQSAAGRDPEIRQTTGGSLPTAFAEKELATMGQRRIEPGPSQESVWDYPRPPRIEATSQHVRVIFGGQVIADTRQAKRVLETSHPPGYYIPPQDIRMEYLERTTHASWCEWKGRARYYTVTVGDLQAINAAWSYPQPVAAYAAIQDYVAFYPQKMDACFVDGEKVRPQPGGFYGGWITEDIVGPFKGGPGTRGW
jgi:drug/metabolite transporter (DMT)-like permease/uncharacterized protein (DUF427 family)